MEDKNGFSASMLSYMWRHSTDIYLMNVQCPLKTIYEWIRKEGGKVQKKKHSSNTKKLDEFRYSALSLDSTSMPKCSLFWMTDI